MTEQKSTWEKFDALIEEAISDDDLQKELQYGTPARKLEILKDAGISWQELLDMHERLSKIIYTGSLKWWFW